MTTPARTRFRNYWKANNRIIAALLTVWGVVSLGGGVLFVEPLNQIRFFGLPLGFWIAQQGAVCVFIVIVLVYARVMDAVDHRYKMDK
jgi:putative solute:sodium symporter small subunit